MADEPEYDVSITAEVQAEMEADPAIAAFIRDTTARIRQAMSELQAGRFKDFNEAMRSTGAKPVGEWDDD